MAASIAFVPSALVAALVGSPVLLAGWALANAVGGWTTAGGAAVGTVALLLVLVLFYCLIAAALVPVSVLLYALAWHFLRAES